LESTSFFLAALVILAFGTALGCAYVYAMYLVGRRLGSRLFLGWLPWIGMGLITLHCAVLALPAVLAPVGPFMQLALGLSLFVLHAQPLCVGYLAERLIRRDEKERRWAKNADDWLAEWECRPIEEPRDGSASP
jgi:hypothetical protein